MGCRQKTVTTYCGTITCKTTDAAGTQVALSNNGSFYGICGITTTLDSILVMRCPGRYTNVGGSCTFVCTVEGLFMDDQDPTFYYECYKSGTKFLSNHKQCTRSRKFNETTQRCEAAAGGGVVDDGSSLIL